MRQWIEDTKWSYKLLKEVWREIRHQWRLGRHSHEIFVYALWRLAEMYVQLIDMVREEIKEAEKKESQQCL